MTRQNRIRPIRSKQDLVAATARINVLMDKEVRSPEEHDEYLVLADLVNSYEAEHYPAPELSPLDVLEFHLERLEMTPDDLASLIGGRTKASEVLRGERELTLSMVRILHRHFKIPADWLLPSGEGPPTIPDWVDLDRFPVAQMAKRGWIKETSDLGDRVEETVMDLVGGAGGRDALPQAFFRRKSGARRNARVDHQALRAWCLHVLCQARRAGLEGIHRAGTINPEFLRDTARLSAFKEGPKLAREKLARHGIALVTASALPNTHLDGAALWTVEDVPVVGMTLRNDKLDGFWFCLLHELAHLGRHFPNGSGEVFMDDLRPGGEGHERDGEREREADEWAREALIPSRYWSGRPARDKPTRRNVLSLAREADVDPAVVAARIRHERNNNRILPQFVGAGKVRRMLMEETSWDFGRDVSPPQST